MVKNLPDLDVLHLNDLNNGVWTDELVSSLPRSLRDLSLGSTEILPSALKSLPPNLQSFIFSQRGIDEGPEVRPEYTWPGQDYAFLPRSLTHLNVYEALTIEDEHLALLPSGLRTFFSFRAPKLTKNALSFMPRHCALQGANYAALEAQLDTNRSLESDPIQDPDPRVVGRLFPWILFDVLEE